MKRFFRKIGRFFWSWGFLKFVLWAVTLIVLFYVEEDWRGARAWAATKAKWEARGESFDFAKLIPPPVPDAQNLAALPLFKMEPDPEQHGDLAPLTLDRALRHDLRGSTPLVGGLGSAARGEPPDFQKIRVVVAANYAEAFKGSPPPDTLAQFDALYPFIGELRKAAAERPACRFEQAHLSDEPSILNLRLITTQITLSRIVALHAVLALEAGKPDMALGDIHVNLQLTGGLCDQPMLVSGLVAVGVTAITIPVVYDGLTMHAWNDEQLAGLQSELGRIDFLTDYQHCMRGEDVGYLIPYLELFRPRAALDAASAELKTHFKLSVIENLAVLSCYPDGWIDQIKARATDFDLGAISFVDPKTHTANPHAVSVFAEETRRRLAEHSMWGILSNEALGPITAAAEHLSEGQINIDEARIACALERHRLARGGYPDSLQALVPDFLPAILHDVMDGQPYRYIRRPDGVRVVYSVGWNQIDEGGALAFLKDEPGLSPRRIDYHAGDWPWVVPK